MANLRTLFLLFLLAGCAQKNTPVSIKENDFSSFDLRNKSTLTVAGNHTLWKPAYDCSWSAPAIKHMGTISAKFTRCINSSGVHRGEFGQIQPNYFRLLNNKLSPSSKKLKYEKILGYYLKLLELTNIKFVQITEYIPDLGILDSGAFLLEVEENGAPSNLFVSLVFHRGNTYYYSKLGRQEELYEEFSSWLASSSGTNERICNETSMNNIDLPTEQVDKPITFRANLVGRGIPQVIEVDLLRSVKTAYGAIIPGKNSNIRVSKKLDKGSCMFEIGGKPFHLSRTSFAVYPAHELHGVVKMEPFEFSANLVKESGSLGEYIKLKTEPKEIIFEK